MEEVPKYEVRAHHADGSSPGKVYYPGGTPWPLPGDTILAPKIPPLTTIQEGLKFSQGKLQYSLIPPYALQEVARNLTAGLKKYPERNNWQKVPNARQQYLDALIRHLESYRRGNLYDSESSAENMHEMAAVAVNAMFLLEFDLNPELEEVKE